jgi:hypothetical protein
MFRGSRHLGKILGYSFSPIKFHLSPLESLASRTRHLAATVGTSIKRGEGVNRVYKKPNGCSATGALAPGPDQQQQYTSWLSVIILRISGIHYNVECFHLHKLPLCFILGTLVMLAWTCFYSTTCVLTYFIRVQLFVTLYKFKCYSFCFSSKQISWLV